MIDRPTFIGYAQALDMFLQADDDTLHGAIAVMLCEARARSDNADEMIDEAGMMLSIVHESAQGAH